VSSFDWGVIEATLDRAYGNRAAMTDLKARVEKLEATSTAGTMAGWLGGMAVLEKRNDGHYESCDKCVLTEDELHEALAGWTGRELALDI
jgi:hypothetical protein